MYTYYVDMIAEDCYDVYVSEDEGYTWEYYNSYDNRELADEEGQAACWLAAEDPYTL
jgi:hypothetical protein